jgi:acetyl esterase/lipase
MISMLTTLRLVLILLGLITLQTSAFAQNSQDLPYFRIELIYGHKDGLALTMDAFFPKKRTNGATVVAVESRGFVSKRDNIQPLFVLDLINRGYTVFVVIHGSQPKYTGLEAIEDMHRSIRYIRANAKLFEIDPSKIGMWGASAGGHLSLMVGLEGRPGDPKAKDPVDRESSFIQAVACFFPPTDWLNYGKPGFEVIRTKDQQEFFRPGFQFKELDAKTNLWIDITDDNRLREIARKISPITHVTKDDPPILLIHGEDDSLVPFQQSQILIQKLTETGVTNKLVSKPKADHGWTTMIFDMKICNDWFDAHLKPTPSHEIDRRPKEFLMRFLP